LASEVSLEQLAALRRTPFHRFWDIPHIPISSRFLIAVLKQWDSNSRSLIIAGRRLPFTSEDLSVVLGLRAYGKRVELKRIKTKSATLRDLFRSSATEAHRDKLLVKLLELAGKTDEEGVNDFVRVFILLVFNAVLFPTKTFRIPPKLFVYVDNIRELECYNWGEAVYEFLVDSMYDFLDDKGLHKLIIQKRITYIDGCILGLLVSA
jgi:hypothetical protein